jgi:hypothetical protein
MQIDSIGKVMVVSVCSREKRKDTGFMPVRKRYLGSHIAKVEKLAHEQQALFYILSGKYGLLRGDDLVGDYDYPLIDPHVEILALMVQNQLGPPKPNRVDFYTKKKPSWEPYLTVMRIAAEKAQVELCVYYLADDD